jgi:hypothetical protein
MGFVMPKRDLSGAMLIVLFLLPIGAGAFSIDRDLSAGEFYSAFRDADTGWRIEGSFTANRNIEFFICDMNNFTSWTKNESVSYFEHSEATTGQSFNFTIPYNSTWYVVFSNIESDIGISLIAEVFYIDQTGSTQTQVSGFVQSTIITPLFIGLLVAILGVCILGIWAARRSDIQPAVDYGQILSNQG